MTRIHPNINTKCKKLTTKQLINKLTFDTIDRAFLISALESYSRGVLNDHSDWKHSVFNKSLWQICAQNTLDTLNEYGGERT